MTLLIGGEKGMLLVDQCEYIRTAHRVYGKTVQQIQQFNHQYALITLPLHQPFH